MEPTDVTTPADLRAAIPALSETRYLNTGASAPCPEYVVDAVAECQRRHAYEAPGGEGMYDAAWGVFDDARATVADLLDTAPANVALTDSTTDGINRVAGAIDWAPGDSVVRTDVEHPAGVLPWQRLAEEGVEVRVVETDRGRLDPADLDPLLDGARLVCLSALTWTHGTSLPVREVVERAHEAGAQVLVDAVQAPGQVPVDVEAWGADFVAGAGHKWLLGPWGAGFLYVRPDVAETVRPHAVGYRSVTDPGAEAFEFHPGARRFEVGTDSPAPYAGLVAAVEGLESLGMGTLQSHVEALTDRLKAGLGDRLLSPAEYESGLVTFEVADPSAFVAACAENDVMVRDLPTGTVRASVHAFNTAADVDALLDCL